jgi:ribosome-binding protein aMBF1 (putative translation factor)
MLYCILLFLLSCCPVQDELELKLMNLLSPDFRTRHSSANPYIVALNDSSFLQCELGLKQTQEAEIESCHNAVWKQFSEVRKIKFNFPRRRPNPPNTDGLGVGEIQILRESYYRELEVYDEAKRVAREKFDLEADVQQARVYRDHNTTVIGVLSTDQRIRYGQIMLQSQLSQGRPLGIYFNPSLRDWVELSPKQFEELRLKAKKEHETLVDEVEKLVQDYHTRIQQVLQPTKRELVAQTLKDDPNWTAEPPTQVAYRFLSRKYLLGLRIQGVHQLLQRNIPLQGGIGIRDFIDMSEGQVREVDDLIKSVNVELPTRGMSEEKLKKRLAERNERIDELDRRIVEEVLLPHQARYLARTIILSTLNKPTPFGLYRNEKFVSLFELDAEEAKLVAKASLDEIPNFQRDLRSLLNRSHERVRRDLPTELKQGFRKVFGDATMFAFAD